MKRLLSNRGITFLEILLSSAILAVTILAAASLNRIHKNSVARKVASDRIKFLEQEFADSVFNNIRTLYHAKAQAASPCRITQQEAYTALDKDLSSGAKIRMVRTGQTILQLWPKTIYPIAPKWFAEESDFKKIFDRCNTGSWPDFIGSGPNDITAKTGVFFCATYQTDLDSSGKPLLADLVEYAPVIGQFSLIQRYLGTSTADPAADLTCADYTALVTTAGSDPIATTLYYTIYYRSPNQDGGNLEFKNGQVFQKVLP